MDRNSMVERVSTALDDSASLTGHAPARTLAPGHAGVGVLAVFQAGDTTIEYQIDRESGQVGLCLYPSDMAGALADRREYLDEPETRSLPLTRAWSVDCLVQVKCAGDGAPIGYAQGRTMRNAATTLGLRYERQDLRREPAGTRCVETVLVSPAGWRCRHLLCWAEGETAPTFEVSTRLENDSPETLTVEMLSSFSLGGITPFHRADAPGRLWAHRVRSYWSAEGRLESVPVEQWQLERAWQSHVAQAERFGQVGTLPARGFFPFAALEDRAQGVCWGAQLAWAGSWQMEFYRQGDCLSLSGGLADREFGHWTKVLLPSEALESPTAFVAVARGGVDALCRRLTRHQQRVFDRSPQPAAEADLPLVANEFCTSWGNPTHDNLLALARRLGGTAVRYLVIDAGWYADPGEEWSGSHGDWEPSRLRFPEGLAATARAIRQQGLVPGLWMELETCGSASAAWGQTEHLLRRDDQPITVGQRRFWDLGDPWTVDYLAERVIGLLRAGGFGYLKVDYNETLGIGCDGAESPGEGLRRQVLASGTFFRRLRGEMPELVIESCAAGGHRLEPSMLALTSMSSFSDAHETPELPIVAANLHRLMLPRQNQIWAVLRHGDSPQRLVYSLAAGFLGRLCISGELHALSAAQWEWFTRAQALYREAGPVIARGDSWHFGPPVLSYRHPEGWQAILRVAEDGKTALVVAHAFARPPADARVPLPAGTGVWQVRGTLADQSRVAVDGDGLAVHFPAAFSAVVALLRRADARGA